MNVAINLIFALLWSAVIYVALFYGSRSVFALPRQRTIVAAVGVVAFLFGAAIAPLHRKGPVATPAAAPAAPAPPPRDLSSTCKGVASNNIPSNAVGSIDGVIDTVSRAPLPSGATLPQSEAVTIVGWAMDRDRKAIAEGVCLDVDGRIVTGARVLLGFPRPDVATAFQSSTAELSGYDIALPHDSLKAGSHALRLVVIDNNGSPSTLTPPRRLFVR